MIPIDRESLKTYCSTSKIILTCKKKVQNFLTSCKTGSLSQARGKSKVLEGRLRGVSSRI